MFKDVQAAGMHKEYKIIFYYFFCHLEQWYNITIMPDKIIQRKVSDWLGSFLAH